MVIHCEGIIVTVSIDISTAVSLVVALLSIVTTITALIVFFGKLKWNNDLLTSRMEKQELDTNRLGERMNTIKEVHVAEQHQLMSRIDGVDKSVAQLAEGLTYVKETVRDIKDKLPCGQ